MMESMHRLAAILLTSASGCALFGCTLVGQGEGEVRSDNLVVPTCWSGSFDLDPDFFAAVPFREVQQIRLQRGSDIYEVSDGVAIQVNDVPSIRNNRLGEELKVGLPPELLNEIAPGVPQGTEDPPDVSMALYLQFSCHNQNVVLYAVDGTITFDALFSGDLNETVGAEKFTDARFSVNVADPRNIVPGTLDIPDDSKSTLNGWFRFHFKRGQPGQPFP
jgi:hypothetical protein